MNLYTFYTPSHKQLYELYFFPSVSRCGFDLQTTYIDNQICKDGWYKKGGWHLVMQEKVKILIDACKNNLDKTFVYLDCDIVSLSLTPEVAEEQMEQDKVLMAQNDSGIYCAGCMVMRGGETLLKILQSSSDLINKNNRHNFDDQDALNEIIKKNNDYKQVCGHLPEKWFGCPGHFNGGRLWDGKLNNIDIKPEYYTFHANWTEGIPKKMKLMEHAFNRINNKKEN